MIEWRRIVQEYPCTTCGAAPGRPCVTCTGHVSYTPHHLRSIAASKNGWRSPEISPLPDSPTVGHSLSETPRTQE